MTTYTAFPDVQIIILLFSWVGLFIVANSAADNFYDDVDLTWGDHRAQILDEGKSLSLTLDKASGSGFRSKREYLFGRIDIEIKFVAGDSAGTVTAYYVYSSTEF